MNWGRMKRSKEMRGMGFRDLECFNIALLVKQGWRIIQNPDSLVARIYKKYLCHGDFLNSDIGSNPPYAWRSSWNAKKLLNKRLIWRVGDGTSIKIWKDRCVPTPISYGIQSSIRLLDQDARVSMLINSETRWWNIELVREIFCKEEVDTICNLGICPGRQKHKLIWVGTKNWDFTVRSAYHLAKGSVEAEEGSCSNSRNGKSLWSMVWSVKVPRVLQYFLWKVCNNVLSTKENLYKKGITLDSLCQLRRKAIEIVGHIIWSCESVKDVWSECCRSIQKCFSDKDGFPKILEKLVGKLSAKEMQLVAGVSRQI